MEEHICEDINYADVAKSVHMSSYDFHRTFSFIDYRLEHRERLKLIALTRSFPNEIVNDDDDHSIPDFWTECSEKNLIQPMRLLRTEGKRDLYGFCGPVKESETHFIYGIGVLIDEDTDISQLDRLIKDLF